MPFFGVFGIILLVTVLIVLGFVAWFISANNNIVRRSNRCDNAWQTIDTQLQRRSDLIPNLVESVKAFSDHESETLASVIKARTSVINAASPQAKMEASNELTGALHQLIAVAESYPELKSDANYRQLSSELSDTENRISYARQSYNDCVLSYNNAIETFPGSLIAGSRFEKRVGFEAKSDAAREAPKVQF